MLLLTGLIGIFAFPALKTASIVLTALGGGMLLIFSGRPSKNPIKRLTKGFGALYGITGYLSDVLSYVRIFALGLVSGAMGMVFNLIGSLIYDALGGLGIPGVIIGVILSGVVLMALHVFSLFINTLGAFAHTARLQFIEFFGKFYEAGGVKFKPLSENTKNVQLLNRETDAKTV
jgi:V/A-type H+-transporting ATPase subunit I